ncbi:hypothetical protein HYW43_01575 [Candidatus Daviesbacteria bacterium]|nr:hypothetical protein [Candidatus Daviesbacteria bacterium]
MEPQGTIYFPNRKAPKPKQAHTRAAEAVKEDIVKDIQEKIIPDETEAHKEISKGAVNDERSRQKMEALVDESQNYLLKISTHYFFETEPKTVIVDVAKVSIITRPFLDIPLLGPEEVQSFAVENITDVRVDFIPFFGTLTITESGNTHKIKYLKKQEAILARRIIQGILIFKKNGLSLTGMERFTLLSKLETIGKTVESV